MDYIGLAYDPVNFNCWHLVQRVQAEQFNRVLPDIAVVGSDLFQVVRAFDTEAERYNWQRIDVPEHGCCVLMRRARLPIHVGVWLDIDGGGVLHNVQTVGAVFQKPAIMAGLVVEGYYAHV